MTILRPVRENDLDRLVELATNAGFGLTTLPRDRELLRKRILNSENSFRKKTEEPGPESYLFVLENDERLVIGTCAIVAKVGGYEPFYTYRIEQTEHHSDILDVHKSIPVLHLLEEHDGPTEIGSLFLSPEHRNKGLGRFLSLSRFLFIAEYRELFEDMVIAEMRGKLDSEGNSAFWEALGRHFFDVDLPTADYLSMKDKRVIAELMPEHPIYIPLLPENAQDDIGQVHEYTKPALSILQKEGFEFAGMVDIFEAGPLIGCATNKLRIVDKSTLHPVATKETMSAEASLYLVSTSPDRRINFRAVYTPAKLTEDQILISKATARTLSVGPGDVLRAVPIKPESSNPGKPSLGMHI